MWLVVDNQMIGKDVWSDNISIPHYNSIVLEEDHYYPFGLTMNINATNIEAQKNPYKYQGIELEKHFGLEQYETFYRGVTPYGYFTQSDPKAEADYSISPYAAMGDNPVKNVDPMGDVIKILGDDANAAKRQLNKSTSLHIKRDKKTGELTATGKAKTPADQKLLDAINDKNVIVNVDATKSKLLKNGNWYVSGAFGGSTVQSDGKVVAEQVVNPEMMNKKDKFYNQGAGTDMKHEVLESYIGAQDSPGSGVPTFSTTTQEYKNYKNAHDKARALDSKHIEPDISVDPNTGQIYINKPNPALPSLNIELLINDLSN